MVKTGSELIRSLVLSLCVVMLGTGCGYTTKSNLPEHIKTIHVEPVKNAIDLSTEVSDKERFRVYSAGDDIQEYRLSIVLDVSVYEAGTHKMIWQDAALTGDTSFFLSGSRAVSEDVAAAKAVEDVARRVVEKTIEIW